MKTSADLASEPLGRILIVLFTEFEHELLDAIHRIPEFASITSSDHQILRCLGESGTSIVGIAGMTGTTKQAVSKAVASLENKGFISRKPHPSDGRAQVIAFSPKGKRLYAAGMKIIASIEKKYARVVGSGELERTKRALTTLFESYPRKENSV